MFEPDSLKSELNSCQIQAKTMNFLLKHKFSVLAEGLCVAYRAF
jgi:hypothetical protein